MSPIMFCCTRPVGVLGRDLVGVFGLERTCALIWYVRVELAVVLLQLLTEITSAVHTVNIDCVSACTGLTIWIDTGVRHRGTFRRRSQPGRAFTHAVTLGTACIF